VRHNFAKRPLGRRLVALVAAYAIALSSLIASFGAARAAAAAADTPGGIICHSLDAGQHAPADGQTDRNICSADCCVGCLLLVAALPPPPVNAVAVARSSAPVFAAPTIRGLTGRPEAKSHRSRAPPQAA
jgi:hypothetical protein